MNDQIYQNPVKVNLTSKINKILIFILIVLIVITLFEVLYLWFLPSKKPQLIGSQYVTQGQNPIPEITQSTPFENIKDSPLISKTLIGYLKSRKQTKNQKFYLTEEVFGHIDDLFINQSERGIVIVDENNIRVLTIMRDEKTKYYRIVDNKRVPIGSKDLKIGDKIRFTSYTDLITNIELSAEIIIEN